MPELPEVEEYGRYFTRHALNRTIKRVDVRDERILGIVRKDAFTRRLRGRAFTHVRRHGKHLFVQAGTTWLHLHFGMTGDLLFYRDENETPRFARVVFDFADRSPLAFPDRRLCGVVILIDAPDTFSAEHRLGGVPLDAKFKVKDFRELIAKRR